jgi:hypothetical protein
MYAGQLLWTEGMQPCGRSGTISMHASIDGSVITNGLQVHDMSKADGSDVVLPVGWKSNQNREKSGEN